MGKQDNNGSAAAAFLNLLLVLLLFFTVIFIAAWSTETGRKFLLALFQKEAPTAAAQQAPTKAASTRSW